jgi:hypothetical protein
MFSEHQSKFKGAIGHSCFLKRAFLKVEIILKVAKIERTYIPHGGKAKRGCDDDNSLHMFLLMLLPCYIGIICVYSCLYYWSMR